LFQTSLRFDKLPDNIDNGPEIPTEVVVLPTATETTADSQPPTDVKGRRKRIPFNPNDPEYHTCFCGAHLTSLLRVLIVIYLIVTVIHLLILTLFGSLFLLPNLIVVFGLLISCLGVYGIWRDNNFSTISLYSTPSCPF
ncbi:hypothetical protein PMAYCL1PPCAC_22946, partial [Pristionchus mayeri]